MADQDEIPHLHTTAAHVHEGSDVSIKALGIFLAVLAITMVVTGDFVGGLGKFEGATGRYEYKGSGRLLAFDRTGLPFGGFELRTRGKVTLPK